MLYATVRQRKIHVKNPVTVIQNGVNVDNLLLDMDDEWREMTSIVAVFTLKYTEKETVTEEVDGETVEKEVTVAREISKEMLYTFGETVMVPWECLQYTGRLSVSVTGYVDSEKVMTTMLPDSFWSVVQNGTKTGDTPLEPTQTLYEQVLAAAGAANAAASAAIDVSNQLVQDKENGVFDGKDGVTPTVEVGTVLTGASGSMASVENVGTPTAVKLNFTIPRGLPGKNGTTPVKGVDYFDGYTPVKGIDYFDGAPGYTPVKGVDYFDGEKGYTPKKGVDYFDGETPVKGVDYFDGKDAAQIVNMVVDENYHLIITLDNGIVFDAGYVRGAAGAGAGDMLASEYDPQSAVRLAGGIPQYVAENAPAPDLDGYAKTEDIPTKTSQLENDSNFLTQHQSLEGYAKTTDIPKNLSDLTADAEHRTVTDAEKNAWSGKSNFSGSWNDLEDKPVVSGGGDTLTWDGNTDGLVSAADTLYKVSDSRPSEEELQSGAVILNSPDGPQTYTITDIGGTGPLATGLVTIGINPPVGFVVHDDAVGIDIGGMSFSEPGLYLLPPKSLVPELTSISLVIPGYTGFGTCEKFDPSLLYQPDWNQTDTVAADFIKNKPTMFSGSYNDLSDVPTSFPAATHSQPASTITAGTLAGQVVANASGQAPGTSLVRNTKLVVEETTPTVNGEIFWVYG